MFDLRLFSRECDVSEERPLWEASFMSVWDQQSVCVGPCIHVWAACICVRGCWCLCHTSSSLSPAFLLYVTGCRCHHGYGSSMITAVTGNFRPSWVLPSPVCHDNAVNRTKVAGDRTVVSMLQIQHTYCKRIHKHTHTHQFSVLNIYSFSAVLECCVLKVLQLGKET